MSNNNDTKKQVTPTRTSKRVSIPVFHPGLGFFLVLEDGTYTDPISESVAAEIVRVAGEFLGYQARASKND